jgi:hypothetical protein
MRIADRINTHGRILIGNEIMKSVSEMIDKNEVATPKRN